MDAAAIDSRIEVLTGDITTVDADAIVNAANTSLLGGGGVDGAIHRAAGSRLLEHCRTLGGCATGLAKATPGFDLEPRGIRQIFHAVGPIWDGEGVTIGTREDESLSNRREDVLLASCYQTCLALAKEQAVSRLAFPCISTGVYGFPIRRAAMIAYGHVHGWLSRNALPTTVIFCCFSDDDAEVYREVIATREQWMLNRKRG